MNIFGLAGMSSQSTYNNLGGFRRLISNNKFHEDLRMLLETQRGTLIGDPDFGSNLHELLFEPAYNATAALMRQDIADCIEKYYSNVVINSIDITFTNVTVKLFINYTLMNTNVGDTVMLEFIRGNVT